MVNLTVTFAALMLGTLAMSEAAVYIGGGCYDCNPPGGQGPGIYTGGGRGGGGGGRGGGGAGYYNPGAGGGGGGGSYYNAAPAGGGGRPVYSGNFGPGYSNGGRGGGGGYDDGGLTQIISG